MYKAADWEWLPSEQQIAIPYQFPYTELSDLVILE